ncbi:hypothetical protein M9H77_36674 [Catharanthus roseus]|uniref:Uncharacterized protein n=1 Tax=Catharanthus roseus TaxID=4058 RepID=A0ACB9ZUC2_CATRO|nr:hypothetical protein M9H77_36674 [Catharanthus roseus]
MNTYGYGAGGPGPGPGPASAAAVWGHEHHSLDGGHHAGFLTRFLYNFCTAITTCTYFACCCWLLRDCFTGSRDGDYGPLPHPYESYGPPEPPLVMPGPPGQPELPGPPPGAAPFQRPFY